MSIVLYTDWTSLQLYPLLLLKFSNAAYSNQSLSFDEKANNFLFQISFTTCLQMQFFLLDVGYWNYFGRAWTCVDEGLLWLLMYMESDDACMHMHSWGHHSLLLSFAEIAMDSWRRVGSSFALNQLLFMITRGKSVSTSALARDIK